MKIGVVGDVHWCSYSSIVRSNGKKYTTRLENLIQSINWAEKTLQDCDMIVYLGDFFDKSELNAMEITAIRDLRWAKKIPHYFLVGNHELYSKSENISLNSLNVLSGIKDFYILYCPFQLDNLYFIPYDNYKGDKIEDIFSFLKRPFPKENVIIFSHNDIKGLQYGGYLSTNGVDKDSIENNCALFINGHLHNHTEVGNKIINLGNISGQNFSEDAAVYKHYIMKVDSNTLEVDYYKNPYAMNFYKLDCTETTDSLRNLEEISVVSVVTSDKCKDDVKRIVDSSQNIVESMIRVFSSKVDKIENQPKENVGTIEHFYSFLKNSGIDMSKEFVYEVLS